MGFGSIEECIVCGNNVPKVEGDIDVYKLEGEDLEKTRMHIAGFCSVNCMKQWIPDTVKIDTKENNKLIRNIHTCLGKMRKAHFVFDEDTTQMMIPIFNRRIFSVFNEEDRDYLVHLYYKSAKWHIQLMSQTTLISLLYDKWSESDKELWLKSAEKFIQSEINRELEDTKAPKDREIWKTTIIMHMSMFSSIPLVPTGTEIYEKEEVSS